MSRHIPNASDLIQQYRDTAEFHLLKANEAIARAERLEAHSFPPRSKLTGKDRTQNWRARRRQLSSMEAESV